MGPIGCIPYQLTLRLRQNGQCDPKVNAEARQFNAGVVSIVKELNVKLPGAKLIVVDAYKGVSEMIANPAAYGMYLSSPYLQVFPTCSYPQTPVFVTSSDFLQ